MKIPIKIEDPTDYRPGTKIARITEKKIWLVEITMPKSLMSDIRTGSIEMEEQEIDLAALDKAYTQNFGKDQQPDETENEQQPAQPPAQ
jgi:hypothetical protein